MNLNNKTFNNDEIDLKEIILTLWEKKITILIITLFFTGAGYLYGIFQPKYYEVNVTVRNAPDVLFEGFYKFQFDRQDKSEQQREKSIVSLFNEEFRLNFMSLDNLSSFVEQNKKIDEFKSYLKKNNINMKIYFQGKFRINPIDTKYKNERFSFTFSKPFPAKDFLSDYIIYTKQTTENTIRKLLRANIENKIKFYKQGLKIAEKINLEDPILKSLNQITVVNEPEALFYMGSKVLTQEIIHFEELLKDIESFVLEYNPIINSSLKPTLVSKPVIFFISILSIAGLFISLIFVFLRSLLIK